MPESMKLKYEIVLTYPSVCIAYCRTIIAKNKSIPLHPLS